MITKDSAQISESLQNWILDDLEERGVTFTNVTISETELDIDNVDNFMIEEDNKEYYVYVY